MVDQWNDNKPAVGNQVSADVPDIEENFGWLKRLVQMAIGWKDSTIGGVGPPNHRAKFSHVDDDTITIGPGSYFHDGTTRQSVFWDADITFECFRPGTGGSNADNSAAGASEWHYIYIDDSAVVTQADTELDADCFLNSTTAPTWSDAKHGWYNGSDRCIFAILTDGTSDILEFYHYDNYFLYADAIAERSATALTTSWEDVDIKTSVPAFSTMANAGFFISDGAAANWVRWRINDQTGTTGHRVCGVSVQIDRALMDTNIMTDSGQVFEIRCNAETDDVSIEVNGWYLPIGF